MAARLIACFLAMSASNAPINPSTSDITSAMAEFVHQYPVGIENDKLGQIRPERQFWLRASGLHQLNRLLYWL